MPTRLHRHHMPGSFWDPATTRTFPEPLMGANTETRVCPSPWGRTTTRWKAFLWILLFF